MVSLGAVPVMVLAACGGGGGGGSSMPPVDNAVPASATASPEAFSNYAGSIGADDQAEPLNVEKVQAPASDTADPIAVS
jgi:hypothetical protein